MRAASPTYHKGYYTMNEKQITNRAFEEAEFHQLRIGLALDLAEHLHNAGFGISLINDRYVRVYLSARQLHAYEVELVLTDDYEPFVTVKQEPNSVLLIIVH